jgi:hypothetical protein
LYTFHVGGYSGEWRRITQGSPLANLSTAMAASSSGELVIAKDTFELVKGYVQADTIKKSGDFLVKKITQYLSQRTPLTLLSVETRMEPLMRSFIDRNVLTKMDSGQSNWLSTIKPLTIVFISIAQYKNPGVTEEQNMNETIPLLHNNVFSIQQMISDLEGSVGNFLMDEKGSILMLAFGHPTVHDNDSLRAIKTAEMVRTKVKQIGGTAGFGIARGMCYVGTVGSSHRQDFAIMGDPVNLAARFAKASESTTEIYCDEEVSKYLAPLANLETLSPMKVKGKKETQKLSKFVSMKDTTENVSFVDHSKLEEKDKIAIFGREEALKEFIDTADEFQARRKNLTGEEKPVFVLVKARSGAGKTSFLKKAVQEVRTHHAMNAVQYLRDTDSNTPFFLFKRIILQLYTLNLVQSDKMELKDSFGEIEKIVSDLPMETKHKALIDILPIEMHPYASLVNNIMFTSFEESPQVKILDAESKKFKTIAIIHEIVSFVYLANAKMVNAAWYMYYDNLHRADEYSRLLLLELFEDLTIQESWKAHDLLLIATVNTDNDDILSKQAISQLENRADVIINLDNLSKENVEKTVVNMLNNPDLHSVRGDILDLIYEKSDHGNPQIVTLMTQYLIDKQLLITVDHKLIPLNSNVLHEVDVPSSVSALMQQKIDRLTPNANLVVKIASMLGQEFCYDMLYSVFPDDLKAKKELRQNLDELIEQGMLETFENVEAGELYRFTHNIIREKSYALLVNSQKRKLHRSAANYILKMVDDKYACQECSSMSINTAEYYSTMCIDIAEHILQGYSDYDPLAVEESDGEVENYEESYQVAAKIQTIFPYIKGAVSRLVRDAEAFKASKLQEKYIALLDMYAALLGESTEAASIRKDKMEAHHTMYQVLLTAGLLGETSKKHIVSALELCNKDDPLYFDIFVTNWFVTQWIPSGPRMVEDVVQMVAIAKKRGDRFLMEFSYTASAMANFGAGNLEISAKHVNKSLQYYFRNPEASFTRSVTNNFQMDSSTMMAIYGQRSNFLLGNFRSAYLYAHDARRYMKERHHERTAVVAGSFNCWLYAYANDISGLEKSLAIVSKNYEKTGAMFSSIWVQAQVYFALVKAHKAAHSDEMAIDEKKKILKEAYDTASATLEQIKRTGSPNMIFPYVVTQITLLYCKVYGPDDEVIEKGITASGFMIQQQVASIGPEGYRLKAELLLVKRQQANNNEAQQLWKQAKDALNSAYNLAQKSKAKTIQLRVLDVRARMDPTKQNVQALQDTFCKIHPSQWMLELEDFKAVQRTLAANPIAHCSL